MTDAVKPVLTLRPAVLKNSDETLVPPYLLSRPMMIPVATEKNKPKPMTIP